MQTATKVGDNFAAPSAKRAVEKRRKRKEKKRLISLALGVAF